MFMIKIGIIREDKVPQDTRVPLTPQQCLYLLEEYPGKLQIEVQSSEHRAFKDQEYIDLGIQVVEDISESNILLGVKEVPIEKLIPNKTYLFFSHTIKKQPYNEGLMKALINEKIRMIDYELLTYADLKRIIGFGYYAGVVGAHNGILTYGKKHQLFDLKPAHECHDLKEMIKSYRNVQLPNIKIALTGSGRVTAGLLHIMEELEVQDVEPEDYLRKKFDYPVYTHLKGDRLYTRKSEQLYLQHYERNDFHAHPEKYRCLFPNYITETDILLNGIFWDNKIDPLFTKEHVQQSSFKISVISDVTCDIDGSVPINIGASTIDYPVYGISRKDFTKQAPFQNTSEIVDIMAVDNLPNELPRDASEHFGEKMLKFIIPEFLSNSSEILDRATICKDGKLTELYEYLEDYAY